MLENMNIVEKPNGDICVVNVIYIDNDGLYYLPVKGTTPDVEVVRELVGVLSDCIFLYRTGYTLWLLNLKSFRKMGLIGMGSQKVRILHKKPAGVTVAVGVAEKLAVL